MPKITTHSTGDGYFTAEVDGYPLIGNNGGESRFKSRKIAKDEADRRWREGHAPTSEQRNKQKGRKT